MNASSDLSSEYTCSICFQLFEEKSEKLPRLLHCGHTFCSQCIINLLEQTSPNIPFLCPEDQVESKITKKEITSFPKNYALLKLMEKNKNHLSVIQKLNESAFNESLVSMKEEELGSNEKQSKDNSKLYCNEKNDAIEQKLEEKLNLDRTFVKEYKGGLNEEKNTSKVMEKAIKETKENLSRNNSEKIMKESIKSQDEPKEKPLEIKEEAKEKEYSSTSSTKTNTQNNYFGIPQTKKICPEHQRKLEVICIDHQTRICTNCALFGVHKNHNIRPELDVQFEITSRAESLLNLYQEVDNNQNHIESEAFFDFYKGKIKEKEFELFESINNKFEELITKIKTQQDKLINELHQKFEDLSDRFKSLTSSQKDLNDKIFNWKSLASKMLNTLTAKGEKDEISFEFLPNLSYPQIDIIKRGEAIYLEQELTKDNATKLLMETLKNIKVSLKENCFHFLDSFCKLDCSFPSEISKKWVDLSSKAKISSLSFFPTTFKFEKPHTMSLEEKISNKFEEKSSKQTTCNDFLNDHDDENDLLSSELINFTLTDFQETNIQQTIQTTQVINKNSSDNSIVYSNNSHINNSSNNGQNASGFGNLTPIRSQTDIVLPGGNNNNNHPKVLMEMNGQAQGRKANVPSNEKPQMRGNTPNTDRRLFTNGDVGSNGGGNGSKLYKKKTKFLIGEKFEPVLEGLKKDGLEIVDFTGAELGDIGLQNICDYVRVSKTMKSLKLLKNKITNEGVPVLLKALSENTSLISLNLAQNLLSDKVLDLFTIFFQTNHSIKLLCLNQNNINVRNAKTKVSDFKKLGITVSV